MEKFFFDHMSSLTNRLIKKKMHEKYLQNRLSPKSKTSERILAEKRQRQQRSTSTPAGRRARGTNPSEGT